MNLLVRKAMSDDAGPGMRWRAVVALLVTLTLGSAVVAAWLVLREHERNHHATLFEAESYATRSHLARELAVQADALRAVARFWSDYGHLPAEQWGDDAHIELSHFPGFETLLWSDPERGVRYATGARSGLRLDYSPGDAEWRSLAPLLDGFEADASEAVIGPEPAGDGSTSYRIRIRPEGSRSHAVLVARIDATTQLRQLLQDRSPGHAVAVSWEGRTLYSRGDPAADVPESWRRSGMIELAVGGLWEVVHVPTAELADLVARPTLPGLLVAGWAVALLVGGLIYQVGGVRLRALEARRAEARVAKLNAELEQRVAERTQELAERTADLETVFHSVSHDIRGPLNTIGLTSAHLAAGHATDATRIDIERLDRAAAQITGVLERLTTFSTVAFASLERSRVDMHGLALAVVQQLRDAMPGRLDGIRIEVAELPPCLAQPMLVEILLYNVISNAAKYSAARPGPHIEISASAERRPVVYRVRDNGVGFASDKAQEIFRPFVRLASDIDGQGLGLAIAERVARRHGGSIWAEAVPGDGATFYFELGAESFLPEPAGEDHLSPSPATGTEAPAGP